MRRDVRSGCRFGTTRSPFRGHYLATVSGDSPRRVVPELSRVFAKAIDRLRVAWRKPYCLTARAGSVALPDESNLPKGEHEPSSIDFIEDQFEIGAARTYGSLGPTVPPRSWGTPAGTFVCRDTCLALCIRARRKCLREARFSRGRVRTQHTEEIGVAQR